MDFGDTGNAIAQIGIAAVGAYVGGCHGNAYTGMQIGMAVGNFLFQTDEAKKHNPVNTPLKHTDHFVSPDPVPLIIGTDLCPGNVIWVNRDTMGMVEPSFYENEALNAWISSLNSTVASQIKFFHIEFIASFANRRYSAPYIRNNRVWLDDIHFWLWHSFDDYIHYYHNWVSSEFDEWNPITNLVKTTQWLWWHDTYYLNRTHCETLAPIYWWGAMILPAPTPLDVETLEINEAASKGDSGKALSLLMKGPPAKFPNLKAELSQISQGSSGDKTIPPYDGNIGDRSHTGYSHAYRDNYSHYLYGVLSTGYYEPRDAPWYNKTVSIRKLNFYKYTYELLATHEYTWNNITKSFVDGQSISRQDIDGNPDHLYIIHGKNWLSGNTYSHHHANYSLEYDLFYIDRSDDTVHSICYESRLSVDGDNTESTSRPRIQIRSMEIVGDSILLFGQEHETHSIWNDQRTVTADAEYLPGKKTKIYADFSQYPEGYWVDDTGGVHAWAYMVGNHNPNVNTNRRERYRIITQTSTYIIVDGLFSILPKTGNYLYITRIRDHQVGWSIVGVGSTRDKIICNTPNPIDPRISALPYDSVQFEHPQDAPGLDWGFEIFSFNSSSVNLKTSLPNDPIPGEIIWFTHEFHYQGISYPDDKDEFEHFYDPHNYWFWRDLISFFDWENLYFQYENQTYFHTGLWNSGGWGKNVILKINKNTGEFEGKIYESYFKSYRYTGIQFICVGEAIQISTVSTDAQIAVSFQIAQPYAYLNNNNLVIDKSTLTVVSDWHGYHSKTVNSHSAGKVFRGCVKVRAWDDINNLYEYRWYALVAEFMAQGGVEGSTSWADDYNNENIGYYLLDLGPDGIFPDMERPLTPTSAAEFSSILNLDANEEHMIKWFRPQLTTGPLYSPFFVDQSTTRDSQSLRMYDYDEKLFFVMDRGAWVGVNADIWCYMMPNAHNRYGFSWPVSQVNRAWNVNQTTSWGDIILSCKYYLGFGGSYYKAHFSNFCDCYLATAISYLFSQTSGSFRGFSAPTFGNLDRDYANELIEDKVIYCGKEHDVIEPRFMFSMSWSRKIPLVDMLREILATCQGMYVTQCSTNAIIKLPRPNETAAWYFGHEETEFISNQNSQYQDVIYIDLSDYPNDYWMGDFGIITRNNISYRFTVEKQYNNYIELETSINIVPIIGDVVFLIKDNMIESSFTFAKKPQYERPNRLRVEFINRLMEYKIDIAEADDVYKQEVLDKRIITKQIELHGIKRATQAARMAYRYLDYEQYVNWLCSFQTDLMGSYICYGDIIGITHPVTGWTAKLFRVMRKEELDDFNVMLECEEYVPGIYHDASNPVYQGGSSGSGGTKLPLAEPIDPVRRLQAYYDSVNNIVNVTFQSPIRDAFFVGANISYKIDNGSWINAGLATTSIPSVVYSSTGTTEPSSLEPTRTKYGEMEDIDYRYTELPYDPLTMLGIFPASGYLWVNGELIYYGGIDTVNNKFINVIRGMDVPEYQYAVDVPDDGYNWTNPLLVLADTINAFKFIVDTSQIDLTDETLQTEGSKIEYYVPTITIRAESIGVTGFGNLPGFNQEYSFKLKSLLGRPYSPTLLRHNRDL